MEGDSGRSAKRADWKSVSMKGPLMLQVKRALKTPAAKEMGLNNPTGFIEQAVREMLSRIEAKRFSHMGMEGDTVNLLDNRVEPLGRIVSVVFSGEDAWCEYCEERTCVHVQYVWFIPEVREALERKGMERPPSRPPVQAGAAS